MTRVYFNKSTSNVVAYSKRIHRVKWNTHTKKNLSNVVQYHILQFLLGPMPVYHRRKKKSILNAFYRFKMYLQYDHKNCLPFPWKNKSKSIKCILLVLKRNEKKNENWKFAMFPDFKWFGRMNTILHCHFSSSSLTQIRLNEKKNQHQPGQLCAVKIQREIHSESIHIFTFLPFKHHKTQAETELFVK